MGLPSSSGISDYSKKRDCYAFSRAYYYQVLVQHYSTHGSTYYVAATTTTTLLEKLVVRSGC